MPCNFVTIQGEKLRLFLFLRTVNLKAYQPTFYIDTIWLYKSYTMKAQKIIRVKGTFKLSINHSRLFLAPKHSKFTIHNLTLHPCIQYIHIYIWRTEDTKWHESKEARLGDAETLQALILSGSARGITGHTYYWIQGMGDSENGFGSYIIKY
jgi:hypothetical protein